MENRILKSFVKFMGEEVKNLNLLVTLPDDFDEELMCSVIEEKNNGKVWLVKCSKAGNVLDVYEM